MSVPRKLKTLEEAAIIREQLRKEGKKVVFANGCFDVLHGGHISYLADSKSRGDFLIVGVNSDISEQGLKGPSRPVYKQDERICLLDAVRFVDYIVMFDEPMCDGLLRGLKPDVHSKGTDYSVDTIPEKAVAEELGIEVAICGPPKENASRGVIATVIERYGDL